MKKLQLSFLTIFIIGCSDNRDVSKAIYDLSGVSLSKNATLLAEETDCCSFTGDGHSWFIYEVRSTPKHKPCDYEGVYSNAAYRVAAFEHYLSDGQACIFEEEINNRHKQVAIQGNKVMYSWSSW